MRHEITNESASLWNCTISPGWNKQEVDILQIAIQKFGVGHWTKIVEYGCLPGKTTAQINNQCQRMLGQQSTAEFAGLHIDVLKIGAENSKKKGPEYVRKASILINQNDKLTKQEIKKRWTEHKAKYGLSKEEVEKLVIPKINPEDLPSIPLIEQKRSELQRLREELYKVDSLIAQKEAKSLQHQPKRQKMD
eukprot:Lithocolla_globosa_v1_NODE_9703_length_677_cov_5.725080.p1 type:complete len:192 gc:universal NODE_9703_length_677_cov_5.725080:659-84(-)